MSLFTELAEQITAETLPKVEYTEIPATHYKRTTMQNIIEISKLSGVEFINSTSNLPEDGVYVVKATAFEEVSSKDINNITEKFLLGVRQGNVLLQPKHLN